MPPNKEGAQEKETHFDDLVAAVEDYAIFSLDRDGNVRDWNRGAEKITFFTPSEIIGKHFSCFYPPEAQAEGAPQRELETAARVGRYAAEGWQVRKDGSRFWASVTTTAIVHSSEVHGYLKIIQDLSERNLAHETLHQSEERFRLLVESAEGFAIFMLDPGGHVMSWNTGARRIKGYQANEIIGRHFSVFYPPEAIAEEVPQQMLERARTNGRTESQGWRVRKDGSRFWGSVSLAALRDKNGVLQGYAKITRDLSESREVENLKESSRRKDTFLATLAHELRNPLAPMLPGLEVMLASPENTEVVRTVAATLKRQVDQMSHLIDDLLDMSRITTGKIVLRKVRLPLAAVIESAVETVQPAIKTNRHDLTVILPSSPVEIEGDPHRISQMVSNLLSNAAKYTPPGGKIRLEVEARPETEVRIIVRDNGKGISPDQQAQIFELFDQGVHGSGDGLGIGLTLVRNLAELHGGSIKVHSAGEGRGSDFTLLLPLPIFAMVREETVSKSPTPSEEPPSPLATSHGKSGRILVADDGKNAADILSMFFNLEGFETATAYDGQEAVDVAISFRPDLVCLDLGMPRLDGFEAARRIREALPEVKLVALSGWGSEEDRRRSAHAGFDLHLVKPVKPEDLRALVDRYLTPH
jgi:PAS domain S-box-containing protein